MGGLGFTGLEKARGILGSIFGKSRAQFWGSPHFQCRAMLMGVEGLYQKETGVSPSGSF